MPNRKGGQGPNPQNGGMRPQGVPTGQQVREGADQLGGRLRDGVDSAREGISHGYRQAEGMVARNPAPSLLLGFGLGFGLGVILISVFGGEEETWTDRNIRKPLGKAQGMAEGYAKEGMKAARPYLNEAQSQVSNLTEAAKGVPDYAHHLADAIVSRLPYSVRKYLG